jgi:hypothetical protein
LGTKSKLLILNSQKMKIFKNLLGFILLTGIVISCQKSDPTYDLTKVQAPTNLEFMYDVTQDNSGVVTIMPTAEGVTYYKVWFGDNTDEEVPTDFQLGEPIMHTYAEGSYEVKVRAVGLTNLSTEKMQSLDVSFKAPENLVVNITPDQINPSIISVSATAELEVYFDVYFGEVADEEPIRILEGEAATNTYAEPGDYEIKVVAQSAGAANTEYTEMINISEASDPVFLPIDFESFTVNYAFSDFGGATAVVIDNPDASGINTSAKVGHLNKSDGSENWAGSLLTLGEPINFANGKQFKMKVWSPKANALVKLKIENIANGEIAFEADAFTSISNTWEELVYDFSGVDDSQEYQKIVVFFDFENPGDGSDYYFDDIKQSVAAPPTGIAGTWKVAAEAGALGVGPTQGDISWWAIDDAGVTDRACFFDDEYVFGADGSFTNVLGAETWVEAWQGAAEDGCAAPVAPHDGTNSATYEFNEAGGTITLNGLGAYLGIPKPTNDGELASPADAPESVTYIVELQDGGSTMIVDIEAGTGVWWRYKMVKEGGGAPSPLAGTWQVAAEAGSLGVGPAQGDISWWAIDDAGVTQRACFYDDTYVFGNDGSFVNFLGNETWVEAWQGVEADGCGTPVAPHDGSNAATFVYDEGAGTITLNGLGAYLGIPKPTNTGELTSPADAPESITYIVDLQDASTMIIDIEAGTGVWWRYKMVKR